MDHQSPLFRNQQPETGNQGTVECLGMTFPKDERWWKYFLEKLREKLKDLEFRKIEELPIGSDEGILTLSDPPYHTAYPKPFVEELPMQKGGFPNNRKKNASPKYRGKRNDG